MNKDYIIQQIIRVENIIKNNTIKLNDYCTMQELKDLKTLKNTLNYKRYKEDKKKYDITQIQYKYFKNSYDYKRFKKDILLNYLDDIINLAYKLELLDNNFTY